jgi:hypothetical protein
MIKKLVLCALAMCSGSGQAFEGAPKLITKASGIEQVLTLNHWTIDGRGVPSFDYVYEQRAGGCPVKLAGHAVAGYDEQEGKVELEVYNPEDDNGKELAQILMFYDRDVIMTLPFDGSLSEVSFDYTQDETEQQLTCENMTAMPFSTLFRP